MVLIERRDSHVLNCGAGNVVKTNETITNSDGSCCAQPG